MANINIGGRLHSTATGNTVAGANEILDDSKGKKQSVINQETDEALAGKQATIDDLSAIRSGAAAGATAYQKPSGGVPASDMASGVQTSLGKADTAYQKPSAGVPKTDLESGVQASLELADSAIQARPQGEITPVVVPADYATREELGELEAKVDEFEGRIDHGNISYDDKNYEEGKRINSSGVISDDADCNLTDYIAVPSNTQVLVYRSDGTAAAGTIVCYNASKVRVDYFNITGQRAFNTGENTAFIRFDFAVGYPAKAVNQNLITQVFYLANGASDSVNIYELRDSVQNTKQKTEDNEAALNDFLQRGEWTEYKKNYTEGEKFKVTSGNISIIADANYGISDKIDVSGVTDGILFIYRNTTSAGVAVAYAEDDSVVDYWNITTYRKITNLPASVKYVRVDFLLVREQGTENAKVCYSNEIAIWQREENETEKISLANIHSNRWNNIELTENPLDNISVENRGAGIIKKWGFIGDSLSSGYFSTTPGYSRYDYSWPQRMCRMLGVDGINYSKGGYTAKSWCNTFGDGTEAGYDKNSTTASTPSNSYFPTDPHQGYVVAFGVNDYHTAGIAPGDVDTDIDMADYTHNADTYAGWMGQIIQRIKIVNPNAVIFLVTTPHDAQLNMFAYNQVVRDLAGKFTNTFVIDLEEYSTSFSDGRFVQLYFYGTHLSALGYEYAAVMMMTYIDWIIRKNPQLFQSPILLP